MKKNRVKEDSLAFEISFYERILAEDPDFIDALIPLADAYTKHGLYKKGLAKFTSPFVISEYKSYGAVCSQLFATSAISKRLTIPSGTPTGPLTSPGIGSSS